VEAAAARRGEACPEDAAEAAARRGAACTEDVVEAAARRSDVALVIVGRTAGEDQDNHKEPGSYYLTDIELDMIRRVAAKFSRMAVILNVGNIIDMSWVEETKTPAVLYAWQGGQEGGNGVCDVLMGRVNPCGKLADTIATRIEDYPSDANFGNEVRNFYQEDIYVGYRYFETFAKEKVQYPFGYGLSYTTFEIAGSLAEVSGTELLVKAAVTNTGSRAGKEVVQVYVEAPCGTLGKPARVLAGFAKTTELAPGASEELSITIPKSAFASYDDDGRSGHKSAFVLEAGCYGIYVGSDVRSAKQCGSYEESDLRILEQLEEACAPVLAMKRMTRRADGSLGYEDTPLRTVDPYERMKQNLPEEAIVGEDESQLDAASQASQNENRTDAVPYAGEPKYQLGDVYDGKISLDTFLSQLSDEDLICLFRGEGMCSPKVTPGCGGALGGLTERLRTFGIPAGCCTDGPSGLRLDCGTKAFSLPNGAALASTFNLELVQHLFYMTGLEMRKNRVDILLGPGMNIHRHPLNGRNFEYFSEDPFLTGKMAAAQLLGTEPTGTTLTIKHFATNNQEYMRQQVDAIVSERALREIYLKGFEIAVKEGKARAVMTTYAPMNGIWTSGNYDLVTTILRKQWGYDGLVMTDWWAKGNVEGQEGRTDNRAPMVAAQNDIYMVNADASDMKQDNVLQALREGRITRGQLLRNAKNILGFLLKSPAMLHELHRISEEELAEMKERDADDIAPEDLVYYDVDEKDTIVIDGAAFAKGTTAAGETTRGSAVIFGININKFGLYEIELYLSSDLTELAQLPVTISFDNIFRGSISIQGTGGATVTRTQELGIAYGTTHFVKLYFGANGLRVKQAVIRLKEEVPMK
jgi:beta-glucosidase